MSALHDMELADTLETKTVQRKRRKRPANTTRKQQRAVVDDPTFLRIRAALCDEHPADVDLDEHAARITLVVLEARGRRR